ncbi:MAG: trigger factor [Deltaproteobacteria bacterium]|jgi:trigger factor|nr:trigger factor [Deltaproteobacteria bacterium]
MSDSPISVETTETSAIQRSLRVEVDAKRVRKAFDRAYKDLGRQVQVRGFRPGKAPRSVLEKMYGGSIGEELEQQLVRETLPDALEQAGVEPVSEPQVDAAQPTAGEPFSYTAVVEVKPAIELPELAGLPAQKPSIDVTDDEVEEELTGLRERRAYFEDEEAGTPAAQGSHVTIDYLGKLDGEPFEGGAAEGATVEIGAGRMIPGFEEGIEGMSAGDAKTITVTFPEEYQAAELAGREATFDIDVRQVKRRVLPELDDALAKELDEELESLDALRERLRNDLAERKEASAKEALHRSLVDALIERTEFDVPPGMIERRLNQQIQRAHQQLADAMPHEELHQRLGEWSESWRPEAEREVREHLLLDAIAEKQGIEVSDEDLQAKLEEMAREQGMDPDRLRSLYDEQGMLEALRAQLGSDKALEFLIAGAKVEEVAGT